MDLESKATRWGSDLSLSISVNFVCGLWAISVCAYRLGSYDILFLVIRSVTYYLCVYRLFDNSYFTSSLRFLKFYPPSSVMS